MLKLKLKQKPTGPLVSFSFRVTIRSILYQIFALFFLQTAHGDLEHQGYGLNNTGVFMHLISVQIQQSIYCTDMFNVSRVK